VVWPAASAYADFSAEDGRPFEALNIEQQAMIVQHAYMARHGGAAPHDWPVYSRILGAWPWASG
jgi:hypothetical protein